MLKISRWQVFNRRCDKVYVCKHCGGTWFVEDGTESGDAWFKAPKRCPKCDAIMITDKCWFPSKE